MSAIELHKLSRYPSTAQKSLKAYNAADELVIDYANSMDFDSMTIMHDRFGALVSQFHTKQPEVIIEFKSQQKAIELNCNNTNLSFTPILEVWSSFDIGLMKVPKSMDLFQLYLQNASAKLAEEGTLIAGFMTKYFTPKMLELAQLYFEVVEQSLAKKKARLLILKKPKRVQKELINSIEFKGDSYLQHYGVFSKGNIDYATQFFLENIDYGCTGRVLDLASGNGVIAKNYAEKSGAKEVHLMDDSYVAIASSKLNCKGGGFVFHHNDSLDHFEENSFDLVVSNPPFHFEHENNIEVSLSLFKEVRRILNNDGAFELVANNHLNYQTHLLKIFSTVDIIAQNDKFVIYKCY